MTLTNSRGEPISSHSSAPSKRHRPLIVAGVVLGLGQAGFFDGIVLHQLLQWHHMFSSIRSDQTIGGLELNTLGDGLFHLLDWMLTLTGIFLLWKALTHRQTVVSSKAFFAGLVTGIGLFNLVEGIIDHHLLQIHHVKAGVHQSVYDLSFLAVNAVILGIGFWLLRSLNGSDNTN